ncbi:hypothetical protein BU24DRAFT_425506 [Aaosphaeria arxii CBS 175.79]|uniref:C2H2-type domain-containing protein n=1 Tax=Aaosphaeria arxii CBS 175.79 TaxID=1450172 RepID=A0A6A5XKS6_9PLEO|nr:uncharacterized protein BU24DRAFT_425506 [Aaosphaeria arxii CBS 175.79]KAF2012894.1 hypothetical protein BU24DRAFT_425506 [Aaosphaeria arxii CBS 175.79]
MGRSCCSSSSQSSRSSWSGTSSDAFEDVDYQTDGTSTDQDSDNLSLPDSSDEDDGHGRPPEYYRAHAKKVNNTDVVPAYASGTIMHLDRLTEQWEKYCEHVAEDSIHLMKSLTVGDVASFFQWKLDQRKGKGGRKLRGIKNASSLKTYRKQFLQVHRRITGKDMDSELVGQTRMVLSDLARDSKLDQTPREKAAMDIFDVREVSQTTIVTTKKMFKVGRYRIQTAFYIPSGFITGNRPDAILKLQYRHLRVTLLRDIKGGPHQILIEYLFEFNKTFLGPKAPLEFPVPEIIFDPSLILSPHVFLLGLMFADKVFQIPELTPENIYWLDIRPGCNSLVLPIKPEMRDVYVFRKCTSTESGCVISKDRLPGATLRVHLKDVGEIAGFKQVARPYCLRYGAGNAFDQDGNTSADLRNLMMQHANTAVFLNHYLSRRVTTDTQAIVRGTEPQTEIMRAACRMSRWIDPDRPRRLTPEQSATVNDDLQIQELLRRQEKYSRIPSRQEKYKEIGKRVRNRRQQLRRELRNCIRENWDREQAVRDIQQQLSGSKFGDQVKTKLNLCPERTPLHNALIESLLSLPGTTLEEEYRRRSKAINAVAAYCLIEEGVTRSSQQQTRSAERQVLPTAIDSFDAAFEAAKVSIFKETRPKICFRCLGNEDAPNEKRLHSFASSTELSRHFKQCHLARMPDFEPQWCSICDVKLEHKEHLRRHALEIHGTVT